jgi:hypothetical protein
VAFAKAVVGCGFLQSSCGKVAVRKPKAFLVGEL